MPDKLSCRTKNTAIEISYYKNKLAFLACSETRPSLRSHPIRLSAGCNDLRGREVELNLDFTSLQWPIQGRVDQTAVVLRLTVQNMKLKDWCKLSLEATLAI